MPVQTSYPGVYVQEIPSGVRTISGVSTSVTAFLGPAKRGPINHAVTITSYSDFERQYGGLSSTLEMTFAVRQFFLNGGTQAIIVRLAANPVTATAQLMDATGLLPVLRVDAVDAGSEGNQIELGVNFLTSNPASYFNLMVDYASSSNPSDNASEVFSNLSMNPQQANYALDVVNGSSKLVTLTSLVTPAMLAALGKGTSLSKDIVDVGTLLDATHNQFQIRVDGADPVTVLLTPAALGGGATPALRLAAFCAFIANAVGAALITCAPSGTKILITSQTSGVQSGIQILPGVSNDIAARLMLGTGFGGVETDGAAGLRPKETPEHSNLLGGALAIGDLTGPPVGSATSHLFRISIDGGVPLLVDITAIPLAGATLILKLQDLQTRIQNAVIALKPTPSYQNFKVDLVPAGAQYQLKFTPGSRGSDSAVLVSAEGADTLAANLKLLIDGSATSAVYTAATDAPLQNGSEMPITTANQYAAYTGSQAMRTGLYALEDVDIFNLLCLPGITDPGILMECDAYVQTRRAFLLIDAPVTALKPSDMVTVMSGTDLPKSDHAAVFYPWVGISNPLNNGAIRFSSPVGTIAGLMARTDANRGVWKAPAGTAATLNGVIRLKYNLTDAENGILNPLGVNCNRIFPDSGAVAWGSRTLAGSDAQASEWKYIPVRRTALFIEESLFRGLKWVVFEPNDEPLWAQIRLNVGAFMNNLWREGAFQGVKKDDAYFVKCDSETTTQNDIDLGRVNIVVGFAPLKPAEFVILYLQQMAGQIQV